jgi:hypothetical protein
MQYGVSFENFEELMLPYPLVSSAKKLVGGEISESLGYRSAITLYLVIVILFIG